MARRIAIFLLESLILHSGLRQKCEMVVEKFTEVWSQLAAFQEIYPALGSVMVEGIICSRNGGNLFLSHFRLLPFQLMLMLGSVFMDP